jgi:beta-glucanase (GH16 family)
MVINTKAVKTSWYQWDNNKLAPVMYTKNYTSAMVQSWNKFCFTGGVLELSIELPGDASSGGIIKFS